jgi:hypothetical protein
MLGWVATTTSAVVSKKSKRRLLVLLLEGTQGLRLPMAMLSTRRRRRLSTKNQKEKCLGALIFL